MLCVLHDTSLSIFFSSRRRHTICLSDWSSDVCSSDLLRTEGARQDPRAARPRGRRPEVPGADRPLRGDEGPHHPDLGAAVRSEEHTSELQSLRHLVCRLLLEKKKKNRNTHTTQTTTTS